MPIDGKVKHLFLIPSILFAIFRQITAIRNKSDQFSKFSIPAVGRLR